MKWEEAKKFTWSELSFFKWAEIEEDKYVLLQKLWNGEIHLPPEAEEKLQEFCKPFAEEYQKRYGQKFHIKDFLIRAAQLSALLRNLQNLGEEYHQPIQEAFQHAFDLLQQLFS